MRSNCAAAIVASAMLAGATSSSFATTTFTDLGAYNSAVGAHTVITFLGLPDGEPLGAQFAAQGVTFVDGDDAVDSDSSFADNMGFVANGDSATLTFSTPQNHFGILFPGAARISLFNGAALVSMNDFGGVGIGFFGGVLEEGTTFDKVVLSDFLSPPGYFDDLHFGLFTPSEAIPEPAMLGLFGLGLGGLCLARRRRG